MSRPEQRVAFGTSGHRGSALHNAFTESHILAVTQALVEYRQQAGITGPLFVGMDTHALSESAFASAVEVLAANGVETRIQAGLGFTPTPVISHAILRHNAGKPAALADGVVITRPTTRRKTVASNTTRPTAVPPKGRLPSGWKTVPTPSLRRTLPA